jgi:hypothetical protein
MAPPNELEQKKNKKIQMNDIYFPSDQSFMKSTNHFGIYMINLIVRIIHVRVVLRLVSIFTTHDNA